ncbi:hypothetical protein C3F09_03265 [candidate division GN15 bacterium]|uniref:Uncharacterized protein n=1 Tax=candidate division GN15 bacterium TaxID=2072418 RepID=A0A855XAR3_9BACT|nr:MAG: hypothetical protein C3F09_03265 [candidate division GN15 bacterium]
MKKRLIFSPVDLGKVKRYSIRERTNKTSIAAFGHAIPSTAGARKFLDSLPEFLKASDLNEFITLAIKARKRNKPFHLLLGAHTIKVGLSPIIIDLMQRRIVTGLSFNGAGLIHDLELAFFGGTSEDVQQGLTDGSFGMVRETGELCADVVRLSATESIGLGAACGALINRRKAKFRKLSVFAVAQKLGLPVTVHVGIGTDIINQHPNFDPAMTASASYRDFRTLCAICEQIDRGGVMANIGSAVILPEVFLKALTVARNLKSGSSRLTTANFDMIEHYRPTVNVVTRPTFRTGRGFNFVGHHEIMIPLLAWGLKAGLTE